MSTTERTPRWRFWIDQGGTFTDAIGVSPAEELRVVKVPTDHDSPITAIRTILRVQPSEPIPACEIRMGTTVATNALLERKGTPIALVVTRGFADLLRIGDQTRPRLFDVQIDRPPPLPTHVLEIDARLSSTGEIIAGVDPKTLRTQIERLHAQGIRSLAIALMHAYVDGSQEREVAALARELGMTHISSSHEVDPAIGLVARASTTCVDAYLTPTLKQYLERLGRALPGSTLAMMQSNGALAPSSRFRGRDAILSGPAGGVVACARILKRLGLEQGIAFDMGGTSTDVSRVTSAVSHAPDSTVAGVQVRAPMMPIHTIAAGGGSICRYDGSKFRVGPESAGSRPGPLCFGDPSADALTLTDVNLALGRVRPENFPIPLYSARGEERLDRLAHDSGLTRLEVAAGFFAIACDNMAEAIRRVTLARGHDVREHALVPFGAAAGQHACAVARRLGIRTLVVHPLGGVLSALGIGLAPVGWHGRIDLRGTPLHEFELRTLDEALAGLTRNGDRVVSEESTQPRASHPLVELRYRGSESVLSVQPGTHIELAAAFAAAHSREFGYARADHPIEIVGCSVFVFDLPEPSDPKRADPGRPELPEESRTISVWCEESGFVDMPLRFGASLAAGLTIRGPAVIAETTGTLVIEPGWHGTLHDDGIWIVNEESAAAEIASEQTLARDPTSLEVFANRFASIAEQMGVVLRRTALSTNIRERLDFSCAVFDPLGQLIANAPHIPVHLGAMGESVRAILAEFPRLEPGDVFVTNDPRAGGSHLPDVTVAAPVFDHEQRLAFFVANRGHHADIGGITPGSMPPYSRTLAEEGVLLPILRIVHAGVFDRDEILLRLNAGPWPARRPSESLADLEAQIAACRTGEILLRELCVRVGTKVVTAQMKYCRDDASERVRKAIEPLRGEATSFTDTMDDGTPITVELRVESDHLIVDFTGTGPQVAGNLNAPRAVTTAAVLYALRVLVGSDLPLNDGCLAFVDLRVPPGSILDPAPGCAIAAGNVETSQRVVDVLLAAFGLAAASQGTMNNLTFGDPAFGYYETIGGGAGAGPNFHGASGVQTHMTNTRITDPEVLELRFPVRLIEFGIRHGSGGDGQWRGGDGLRRTFEFLAPLRVSLIAERRMGRPFGLKGGHAGKPGRALLDGKPLAGRFTCDVVSGSRLTILTPGGGGWGSPVASAPTLSYRPTKP